MRVDFKPSACSIFTCREREREVYIEEVKEECYCRVCTFAFQFLRPIYTYWINLGTAAILKGCPY